jgi:hypothetical protein
MISSRGVIGMTNSNVGTQSRKRSRVRSVLVYFNLYLQEGKALEKVLLLKRLYGEVGNVKHQVVL